jgi:hypothetical protein
VRGRPFTSYAIDFIVHRVVLHAFRCISGTIDSKRYTEENMLEEDKKVCRDIYFKVAHDCIIHALAP